MYLLMWIGHQSSELVDVEFLVGLNGGRRRASVSRAPVRGVAVPLRPCRPELGTPNCPPTSSSSLGCCQLPVLVLETLDHLVVSVDGAQVVLKVISYQLQPQ